MAFALVRDWFAAAAARRRAERLRWETAARLLEAAEPQRVAEEPDAAAWRLLGGVGKEPTEFDAQTLRDKARHLAERNPYAKNALTLYRNYVVGAGMKQEVLPRAAGGGVQAVREQLAPRRRADLAALWREFLDANAWDHGNRKDWEFCLRAWRDGECFLRLFRQPAWPPRVHFVDPEQIAADPATGLPTHGIATAPGNAEEPRGYRVVGEDGRAEFVPAELLLHTKIGVDGNVKRGLSLFLPVVDALKRFQGWLDVELIQRKVASSIVLVRKHTQGYPGGLASFADGAASGLGAGAEAARRLSLQPGTIIDAQGFDLQFLSPNTHFDDASLLGRLMLLAIAAGLGLPEFMLTSDASNANYASTLAAESPAALGFAAWQSFFAGQWRRLFALVMNDAVRLGLATPAEAAAVELKLTPPPVAVRDRLSEAQADAVYFDRGAFSVRELCRRGQADPDQMERERARSMPPSKENST